MFNLEQSVVQWRQQMVAAGISASTLDELESHLREEIERQIQSGASDQEAFQRTVLQIGQPKELGAEFVKDGNLFSFLGRDKFQAIDRILGSLWLVYCFTGVVLTSRAVIWHLTKEHGRVQNLEDLLNLLMGLVLPAAYAAGIFGSILVMRGIKLGRWIVGTIAGLFALLCLSALLRLIPTVPHFSVVKVSAFTAFYVISAWLVFLPSYSSPKLAGK